MVMLYNHTHTYAGRMKCIGLMGIREELHRPAFVAQSEERAHVHT